MRKNVLLWGFLATLGFAVIVRIFVFDVISISNESLRPHFYPGDFLLISKLSAPVEGSWVLLKDYPSQSNYSVRKLVQKQVDYIRGWVIEDPVLSGIPQVPDKRALISEKKIVGKVILILWSLPCRPSVSENGICSDKSFRFFKAIP